jgi:hypothetical protein
LHARLAQHGVPGVPQIVHTPGLDGVGDSTEQTVPGEQRSAPFVAVQHVSPGAPQWVQVAARQASSGAHELPQQGWPAPPQAGQRPAAQTPPVPAQA